MTEERFAVVKTVLMLYLNILSFRRRSLVLSEISMTLIVHSIAIT